MVRLVRVKSAIAEELEKIKRVLTFEKLLSSFRK